MRGRLLGHRRFGASRVAVLNALISVVFDGDEVRKNTRNRGDISMMEIVVNGSCRKEVVKSQKK